MLEINNAVKKFSKINAVDGFTYSFDNDVYALLGPNGAGKTTLIRCMTNLYPLNSGQIRFNDVSISENKNFKTKTGYLPQSFGLFRELRVKEGLELIANMKGLEKKESAENIAEVLNLVNLEEKANSRIGSLSGGMVRRLGIAQAVMGNPDIVIFDEPTAGLDPEERLRFKSIINKIKKDKLIIISTHIVDDVEALCNKILIMDSGHLVTSGTRDEIKSLAKGKVYVVESDRLDEIKTEYEAAQQLEINGNNMTKILSSSALQLETKDANLEDGYLCALKGI